MVHKGGKFVWLSESVDNQSRNNWFTDKIVGLFSVSGVNNEKIVGDTGRSRHVDKVIPKYRSPTRAFNFDAAL
jgi:hypothetical protein